MDSPWRTTTALKWLIQPGAESFTRNARGGVKTTWDFDVTDVPFNDDQNFKSDWALSDCWFHNVFMPKDEETQL